METLWDQDPTPLFDAFNFLASLINGNTIANVVDGSAMLFVF